MRERDSQPRVQLQMRDEYFDDKMRRIDQFMEKAIRQRELEFKREVRCGERI